MAKVAAKTTTKEPKTATKSASASKSAPSIDKVCQETLDKLQELGIDHQLQQDLEWCLGSYRADNNPVGLYTMAERALDVLKQEKAKKTKGITAKNISDLEKAIEAKNA